jgi:hypothetical protein
MRLALPLLLAAATLGSGCGQGPGIPALDSGIEGVATAGPTCPVAVAGHYCPPKPISAVVAVHDGSGREVTRFTTGGDGRFRVSLAPGRYTLVQPPSPPMPRLLEPVPVTVTAGRYTSIQLDFDTGIR